MDTLPLLASIAEQGEEWAGIEVEWIFSLLCFRAGLAEIGRKFNFCSHQISKVRSRGKKECYKVWN